MTWDGLSSYLLCPLILLSLAIYGFPCFIPACSCFTLTGRCHLRSAHGRLTEYRNPSAAIEQRCHRLLSIYLSTSMRLKLYQKL
ncbi:hypothetical protein B0T21DRAFT_84704 [Apiosordaria backusii]|uniref:Uncharacterized protein n=1 Tax=Apiosordaria backusii TaxID=314023 RepID=A0AA40A0S7_9PEZI|nr:hypothetical protein B0T21DRAFT_84704 [Apiosordaria backusii]